MNENVLNMDLDGQRLSCMIVVRALSPMFLSDSAEQLYLAQDLVAMLRGFWRERSSWFPLAPQ